MPAFVDAAAGFAKAEASDDTEDAGLTTLEAEPDEDEVDSLGLAAAVFSPLRGGGGVEPADRDGIGGLKRLDTGARAGTEDEETGAGGVGAEAGGGATGAGPSKDGFETGVGVALELPEVGIGGLMVDTTGAGLAPELVRV